MKKFAKNLFLACIICILSLSFAVAATVVFNVKTHKYHDPYCEWAKRCTKNCIKIEKSQAIKRGGVPCKVCGGG